MNETIVERQNRRRERQKLKISRLITAAAAITLLFWARKQWRRGVLQTSQNNDSTATTTKSHIENDSFKPDPLVPPLRELKDPLLDFLYTSLVSYLSVGLASGLLLLTEAYARADIAKVATQALSGLSSVPLMAASVVLISVSSLLLIAIVSAPFSPNIERLASLHKPFNGIIAFSTQLPFAIAGVDLATSFKMAIAFSGPAPMYYHTWLAGICLGIAMMESILAYLVRRASRPTQRLKQWASAVFFVWGALILLLTVAVDVIDWRNVTDPEKICRAEADDPTRSTVQARED